MAIDESKPKNPDDWWWFSYQYLYKNSYSIAKGFDIESKVSNKSKLYFFVSIPTCKERMGRQRSPYSGSRRWGGDHVSVVVVLVGVMVLVVFVGFARR